MCEAFQWTRPLVKRWALIFVAAIGLVVRPWMPPPPAMAQPGSVRPVAGAPVHIREIVVGVSNLDRSLATFTDVLKWDVKYRGTAPPDVGPFWGLPSSATIQEAVVGNRASTHGLVRLVQFANTPAQQFVRLGGRWWDTGGVFNINVLVKDLDATVGGLRAHGWHSAAAPEVYDRPGNVKGRMTMMMGPDDLVLSLEQRDSPPLTGWPSFDGASHIDLGYQIVRDIEEWRRFYVDILGFAGEPIVDSRLDTPVGPNTYGLPHNVIGATNARLTIARLAGAPEQGVGARQFATSTGHDYAALAAPPNLGIVIMRFAVDRIAPVMDRLNAAGVSLQSPARTLVVEPYGRIRAFAVRTPGSSGAWLEFLETGT